jgi:hypothetical protein
MFHAGLLYQELPLFLAHSRGQLDIPKAGRAASKDHDHVIMGGVGEMLGGGGGCWRQVSHRAMGSLLCHGCQRPCLLNDCLPVTWHPAPGSTRNPSPLWPLALLSIQTELPLLRLHLPCGHFERGLSRVQALLPLHGVVHTSELVADGGQVLQVGEVVGAGGREEVGEVTG